MSTNLGPNLPDSLVALLSGDDLQQHVGTAFLLASAGEDGYPHPCIVTPGEIVAIGPTLLRLALYEGSSASRNLRARPTATLSLVHDNAAYYIKFDASETPSTDPALANLAVFALQTRHVLEDREPGAEVTSGIRFRDLSGDDSVMTRWKPVVAGLCGLGDA